MAVVPSGVAVRVALRRVRAATNSARGMIVRIRVALSRPARAELKSARASMTGNSVATAERLGWHQQVTAWQAVLPRNDAHPGIADL